MFLNPYLRFITNLPTTYIVICFVYLVIQESPEDQGFKCFECFLFLFFVLNESLTNRKFRGLRISSVDYFNMIVRFSYLRLISFYHCGVVTSVGIGTTPFEILFAEFKYAATFSYVTILFSSDTTSLINYIKHC